MPEGHTIHRLARDLNRDLAGSPLVVSSPQGRFAGEAGELDGALFESAEAWGKHLFLHWAEAGLVHVHLGLIGKMRRRRGLPEPRGSVRMRLTGDNLCWDLTGPMVCALIPGAERAEIVAGLGPDPLRADAEAERFVETVRASTRSLGVLLLDQAVIAGVGNVYRAEILFLLGLDPRTRGRDLSAAQARSLWDESRRLLRIGVRLNRIVTRDPAEAGVPHGRMGSGERLYVYKRDRCRRCHAKLRADRVGGRSIWSCDRCQASAA